MKPLKHWADAVNAILGVWLVVSPWLLGYQDVSAAMWNASIVGVALIAVAMGAIFVPRAWEEWTECGLAVWLVASPWLLGFSMFIFLALAAVKRQANNYLIHEYLHEGWHPLWHSEVAKEVADGGLAFVGTASLAETLLPGALPPPLRATIAEQASSVLRMDVQDLVINQSFRRDVFRPATSSASVASDAVLDAMMLHLLKPVDGDSLTIATSFSEITLQMPAYAEIVAALGSGARSMGDLLALPAMRQQGRPNALQIIALLLHARIAGIGRSAPAPIQAVQGLNQFIANGSTRGRRYDHLAAAALGSAVAVTPDDLRLLDAWLAAEGRTDAISLTTACGADGAPAAGDTAITPESAAVFLDQTLERWRKLGVVA